MTEEEDTSLLKVDKLKLVIVEVSSPSIDENRLTILLKLLIKYASENSDFANVMLDNKVIDILLSLDKPVRSEENQARICSLFVLISFMNKNSDTVVRSGILTSSLINLLSNSNFNVVLQVLNKINIFIPPATSHPSASSTSSPSSTSFSASSSSSSSSSSFSCGVSAIHETLYLLTPQLATIFIQKLVSILSSTLSAGEKESAIIAFLKIAKSGIFNDVIVQARAARPLPLVNVEAVEEGEGRREPSEGFSVKNFKTSVRGLKNAAEGLLTGDDHTDYFTKTLLREISDRTLFGGERSVGYGFDLNVEFTADLFPRHLQGGVVSLSGSKIAFLQSGWKTVYFDAKIESKIWKISMLIEKTASNGPYIGFATKSSYTFFESYCLGHTRSGSCMIYADALYMINVSYAKNTHWKTDETNVRVDMELNMDEHTLHFFVRGKQTSHGFSIPEGGYFGISAISPAVVSGVTLVQLASPTVNKNSSQLLSWM